MAMFVELENGAIINLDHVVTMSPKRLNRLDLINGGHIQLSEADGGKIRTLMHESSKPPQKDMPFDPTENAREDVVLNTNGDYPKEEKPAEVKPKPRRRGRPPKSSASKTNS